ncbi:MerR family transcriptional regulator [Cellvibrio zantedeschiae]|uniref:MerR family transcriptional regulator n=1 Tax=Cellvibrio zantedeschiae TaxID=1237077 RepID=A0ABQ3B0A5_9GAMM|nr:MerR family transcriptional regulator [Cellvibrio zantedeschiae]GGY71349.1 MerR family transcriptional regulator [Cellvibrio zantedeschiae]
MNDNQRTTAAIPIREISRLTGVNSVTLRAWERRYGLIKPLRTHKGHRLYRREDVELVKKIQVWLARGLAIGKVSELLDSNQFSYELSLENIWHSYLVELLSLMSELNLGKLDAWFNQLFSVYPTDLIADQLIIPALDSLSDDIYGNAIKKSILTNRLSEYLMMLTQHQRQQSKRNRVAIVQLTAENNSLLNVLLHYGLTSQQFQSELIGLTTASEIVFAVKQLNLDAIVVYNETCSSLADFQNSLQQLVQKISVPILVGGSVALAINAESTAYLHIVRKAGLQTVFSALNSIFPADTETIQVEL